MYAFGQPSELSMIQNTSCLLIQFHLQFKNKEYRKN